MEHLKNFGTLFYVANPYEYMPESIADLSKNKNWKIVANAYPYFFVLVALEHIILKLQGKEGIR